MSYPVPQYKRTKRVQDEQFDVDKIHQYTLSIYLGPCDCQVAVLDTAAQQIVFFEDYIFNGQRSPADQFFLIKKLVDAHHFLNAAFWKGVNFFLKTPKFAQVPASLFVEELASKYLALNVEVNAEKVLHFNHKHGGVVTIFTIFGDMLKWVQDKYKNSVVRFYHQSVSLLEGIYADLQHRSDIPLYLYIDRFKLHVTLVRQNKLIYYNQFVIKEFIDYIKYTMLVFKAMKMNPGTSRVVLLGYIKEKSPHFMQFSKYIKNVSFGKRPSHLKFGHVFDEIEDHSFFDLYSGCLFAG